MKPINRNKIGSLFSWYRNIFGSYTFIISILLFAFLFVGGECNKRDDNRNLDEANRARQVEAIKLCTNANGYVCAETDCFDETIEMPFQYDQYGSRMNFLGYAKFDVRKSQPEDFKKGEVANPQIINKTLNVCCISRCGVEVSTPFPTKYVVGDVRATCSQQQFQSCTTAEYCSRGKWANAQDSDRCCSTYCKTRLQSILNLPNGEIVSVEKLSDKHIVWFGPEHMVVQSANFVESSFDGTSYRFLLPTGTSHSYTVVEDDENNFQVMYYE